MTTADRNVGRQAALRDAVIDWLRASADVTALLEEVDGISATDATQSDPDEAVQRAGMAIRWDDQTDGASDSLPEAPPVFLSVSIVSVRSQQASNVLDKAFAVQVAVEYREAVARTARPAWIDDLLDAILSELDAQHPPWIAVGSTGTVGGTDEPHWDEDRRRYIAALRSDLRRRDYTGAI